MNKALDCFVGLCPPRNDCFNFGDISEVHYSMIKIVNLLTKGFTSPNGCAFLFPLIKYQDILVDCGIKLNFHKNISDSLYDCDTLLVESKFFSRDWVSHTPRVISIFQGFKEKIKKIIYVDISDSSSWPHARVLPYVDKYVKNQLLRDRLLYLKPLYAHRIYTDYYHDQFNVTDKEPLVSEVIEHSDLLNKLVVGWNSGLADYSLYGPYRMMLYHRLPLLRFLSYPTHFTAVQRKRRYDVSCRMGIAYKRETIAWQRQQIREQLKSYVKTDKLSRRQYYHELQDSRVVISPFGLGEITLKDFEVFLTGGLLVKPDMSHMETWPDFFVDGETMLSIPWCLGGIRQRLNDIIFNYKNYIDIAQCAQDRYRRYLSSWEAPQLFSEHFKETLES